MREIPSQQLAVARLLQVIELVVERDLGLLDGAEEVEAAANLAVLLDDRGDVGEDLHVVADLLICLSALAKASARRCTSGSISFASSSAARRSSGFTERRKSLRP